MAWISEHVDRVVQRLKRKEKTANAESNEINQPSTQLAPPFPVPKSPTTPIAPDQKTTKSPIVEANADREVQVDPWTRAFELFRERNHDQGLVIAYKDHLGFLRGDGDSGPDLWSKDSVEATVKKLLEDRDQKQWKITIMDRDIKIRSQLERLTKFLLWSDPVVKTAVSCQPYAALAWSGVSLILPLLTSGITQNADMLEGFNNAGELQMYWQICEQEYLDPKHRNHYHSLVEPLAKLYSYIIEYHAQVIRHLVSSQASRAWTDIKGSAGWSELTDKINKLDEYCRTRFIPIGKQSEAWTNMKNQLQELHQSRITSERILHHIVEDRKEKGEESLLKDLARTAGDYTRYKDINPERVPGTCEWFLKDEGFSKWRSSSSDLLWVSAGPGCGKSVLSKALVDEGHLNPLTTITITPSSMIFTIPSTSGAIRHALPAHKANGDTLTMKRSELWQILVDCATASEGSEIICVLDALDECEKSSRSWILNVLEKFFSNEEMRSKSKLKFLITSRPYQDLEYSFENFPKNAAYMRLDGDEKYDQIREEIDLVIDAKVETLTRKFNDKTNAAEKIKARLKSMDNRTYLWLYLTLNYIDEQPAMYSKTSSVERLLSHLPSSVADAYESMLSRNGDQQVKRTLLQLVLAAERPLTLLEANFALTLALQDQRMESHEEFMGETWSLPAFQDVVKEYCGLFISIHDSKLSFIHQTAREFLLTKREEGHVGWGGSFSLQHSHGTMLQVCLDYLFISDIGGYDYVLGDLIENSYPLLDYSGNYWPSHIVKHGTALSDNNLNRVRILCDPGSRHLQIWTFVYGDLIGDWRQYSRWTSLGFATFLGLKQFAQLLLEEGAEVNEGSDAPIQIASEQGHEDMVQMLLNNGADTHGRGSTDTTALGFASSAGHQRIVEMLLEHGADVNLRSKTSDSALQEALSWGHEQIVDILLTHGADVNIQSKDGTTALQEASASGHQEIVQKLLAHGADIDIKGELYGTALHAASSGGHQHIVEILLAQGADVHIEGKLYGSAVQAASFGGNQQIVRLLLAHGARPNIENGFFGSAIQAASFVGNPQIVQLLLGQGANPNSESEDFGPALQLASGNGHQQVVETLLSHGADVNLQRDGGYTALYEAAKNGHDRVAKILLDHGADMDTARYSITALHKASEQGHHKVVELLLNHGADIEAAQYGDTPLCIASNKGHQKVVEILLRRRAAVTPKALHSAAKAGNLQIVEILLDHGADINAFNISTSEETALFIAAKRGHEEVVNILLGHGAKVNTVNMFSQSALYSASLNWKQKVVAILLEHGAATEPEDPSHGIALQAAAETGHLRIVEILLVHGANPNFQNGCGQTALHKAAGNGHERIVGILLENGAGVGMQDYYECTALEAAEGNGHQAIVDILEKHVNSGGKLSSVCN
ncbi:hypothetical protein AWENTII_000679 [Aspergillus wentii]